MSAISTEQFEAMQQDLPDWCPKEYQAYVRELFRAYTIHLTQPAQAVDVVAVREVIAELRKNRDPLERELDQCADKLTAALPNANGKEG